MKTITVLGFSLALVALLAGCGTIQTREPAPAECSAGVCILQASARDITSVCLLVLGSAAQNCWDPQTRTAWISSPGVLSKDICRAADDVAVCEQELFGAGGRP